MLKAFKKPSDAEISCHINSFMRLIFLLTKKMSLQCCVRACSKQLPSWHLECLESFHKEAQDGAKIFMISKFKVLFRKKFYHFPCYL